MPEYDANEVLQSYAALLANPKKGLLRDVSDLPFPKNVIKEVLKGCLAMDVDEAMRENLKAAYLALSNFQPLSDGERDAIDTMSNLAPPAANDEALKAQADKLADVMDAYNAVISRSQAELETLTGELQSL